MLHAPVRRLAAGLFGLVLLVSTAVAAPVSAAAPPWQGSVDLYQPAAFTTQPDYITCVSTAVQIMRNLIQGTADHSVSEIKSWYTWGRSQTYMSYSVAGLDPLAWARLLTAMGAGPYIDRSFGTFEEAVSAAAYELRLTGKPIGLLVQAGGHAWVMNGFSADTDPLTSSTFQVTAVRVTGPLYPMQQRNGYDMPPDTQLTLDQLRTYLTAYTDTNPVPWLNKYVIVAPLLLDHPLSSYAPVTRLAGADRYATAAAVSAAFAPGVPAVYVATGRDFPDALAAGPAAARAGAPVLIVDGLAATVPPPIAAELTRLKPARIVIVGASGVVSDTIAAQLGAFGPVGRIDGRDRYETAAAVSAATFAPGIDTVYVATGRNFPDALSGGALSGLVPGPMLLVDPLSPALPPATAVELARLKPSHIVVLGSTAVVPDALVGQLAAVAPVARFGGADRFATSAAIVASFPPGPSTAYVATGDGFADALVGVALAARDKAPLLLVRFASIPDVIAAQLDRLKPARIVVLGGPSVVSDSVAGF
ncbi:MAG TPA: cell wall-binding repeat-containing protein [Candidatus Dormibacteraeota bacterium]|nr:cell wall-binding repeat-containing protein [Candidatus Dormibacteraeota bacterium]